MKNKRKKKKLDEKKPKQRGRRMKGGNIFTVLFEGLPHPSWREPIRKASTKERRTAQRQKTFAQVLGESAKKKFQ